MKAMIMAAGLGSRLQPVTNNIPKALIPLNGIPLLEFIIKKLIHYNFKDIIINVHHFADKIINFIEQNNNFGAKITISDERNQLLETGGGLKKASSFFNDNTPFLVYNVDIISDINLSELYDFHLKSDAIATLAVRNRKTNRYFLFDESNLLCGWKNLKLNEIKIVKNINSKLNPVAFSGIQVIDPSIFSMIKYEGSFSLTNLYIDIAGTHKIQAYIHNNTSWLDVGSKENIPKAEEEIKNNLYI